MYVGIYQCFENVLQKRDLNICKRKRIKPAYDKTEHDSSVLDNDDYEYLNDTASYFLRKERWSFDGA